MKRIKLSLLKKIKSFLLVFMVLILFLPGSLGFAAGNNEDPETLQNCTPSADSVVESVIKTAPMNPEFLEDQQTDSIEAFSFVGSYGQLSSTGYKPSPVDLSELASSEGKFLLVSSGSDLPAVYDLRKEGKVTAVKNQGNDGSCWAFSSIASLESYLLGKEGKSYDFSENNMKNLVSKNYSQGFDLTADDGGNAFISTAYFSRWSGPVNESEDLYDDSSSYSPTELSVQKHIQETFFLPDRTEPLDNEVIKNAILEYGAVYTTIYWNPGYYQQKNYAYRYPGSISVNHAVAIVGWNDSFDRNSFTQVPSGDGAFIVKNSWSDTWGEDGYFYISYYDTKLGYNENAVFTAESQDNYDHVYQYDPLGWIVSKEYEGSLVAWGGNVFSSERNETLKAIGFYTTDLNTAYEIYIYKNPVSGPVNSGQGYLVQESGRYSFPGYHTHVLNSAVPLHAGERFSIVIRFANPSASGPLAAEQPVARYSSKAQANAGESYVSPNGVTWEDISSNSETNLCIKAFTTSVLPEADFSSNVTIGMFPLTVQFTDLSSNALYWKWDLNGDGKIDSTTQNPIYTYGSYGNYAVSLTIGNSKGSDTETKIGYIKVVPLSIDSASPVENITTYKGEKQEFSISTNYACDISWYFNGESKGSESSVKDSSYTETISSPGFYNVTAIARTGDENIAWSWNWTVLKWNPWDSPDSQEGENISTEELQEAIHIYRSGIQIPETGAEITDERLIELIQLWRESSGN
ncbi:MULTISPECIES: lectin like domain-containing protein [Methanosarcina]|uniref:Cell surface protein n=2 Tax=Methanosarcina barkeri TaxID=2208 RepID=A0A0E3LNU7_METBA|nr:MULTISPECIES: lectin like domain-containing protein [Methanosarcina]AKB55391.1 Cell surface protein [Methanosarcina barkeri MS]AKB58875.1 Cell surface protein [Methanosarcina barkeri 227]